MPSKKSKKVKKPGVYRCDFCDKTFNTGHGLDVHIARMHGPNAGKKKTDHRKRMKEEKSLQRLRVTPLGDPIKVLRIEKEPLSCLEEAAQIVRQRRENYGSPRKNFRRIATMWEAILGCPVSLRTVGLMMIAVKLARDVHTPQRDTLVDIAGYVDCIDVIEREESMMKEMPL